MSAEHVITWDDLVEAVSHSPVEHHVVMLCVCQVRQLIVQQRALVDRIEVADGRTARQALSLGVIHAAALELLDRTKPLLAGTASVVDWWEASHAHDCATAALRPGAT